MNYAQHYYRLILKRKFQELDKDSLKCKVGLERHHIIPRSCGGGNDKQNLVLLTCREHFIAHMLLVKMTEGTVYESKMAWAFNMMAVMRDDAGIKRKLSSKLYQKLREKAFASYSTRVVSEKTRKKISEAQKHLSENQMERKRQHARENAARMRGKPCLDRLGSKPWNTGKKISAQTPTQRKKHADALRGCIRITNGWFNMTVRNIDDIPVGFKVGQTKTVDKALAKRIRYLLKYGLTTLDRLDEFKDEFMKNAESEKATKPKKERKKRTPFFFATDGKKTIALNVGDEIPSGFRRGSTKNWKEEWIWITDGKTSTQHYVSEPMPAGFRPGRLKPWPNQYNKKS